QAACRELVRRDRRNILAAEPDAAAPAGEIGDGVVAGALTGAVRADDTEDLARADMPVDRVERHERAIPDAQSLDFEQRCGSTRHHPGPLGSQGEPVAG